MCPAASSRLYAAMNSHRWVHELVLEQKPVKKKMYQRDDMVLKCLACC